MQILGIPLRRGWAQPQHWDVDWGGRSYQLTCITNIFCQVSLDFFFLVANKSFIHFFSNRIPSSSLSSPSGWVVAVADRIKVQKKKRLTMENNRPVIGQIDLQQKRSQWRDICFPSWRVGIPVCFPVLLFSSSVDAVVSTHHLILKTQND